MRPSLALLFLSALAVLLAVALSQPQPDDAVITLPPQPIDLVTAVPSVPSTDTNTKLDVTALPLTNTLAATANANSTDANNTGPSNATATQPSAAASDPAMADLLDSLDTSRLSATQRATAIAAELARLQLLADRRLAPAERARMEAAMDGWLRLPAVEKLAELRARQAEYVRVVRADEWRRLGELAEEGRERLVDGGEEGDVRRLRLVRVGPVRATEGLFVASQMEEPMADFAAQQMEMPYAFDVQQMDQHYGIF